MRPKLIWTAYFLCLAMVLGSLGWFSRRVMELEREQWNSAHQERLSDRVSRAMYRMEQSITTLVLQEALRPFYHYSSYHLGELPVKKLAREALESRLSPSPLLCDSFELVDLHFQIGSDDSPTAPGNPDGKLREIAIRRGDTTEAEIAAVEDRLARFAEMIREHPLKRIMINIEREEVPIDAAALVPGSHPSFERANREWRSRANQVSSQVALQNVNVSDDRAAIRGEAPRAEIGPMKGIWCGGTLLLVRHVVVDREPLVQGCVLDRSAIEERLLTDIRVPDLLPGARLTARASDARVNPSLSLAWLPYDLVPGELEIPRGEPLSPLRKSLMLAIAATLVAGLAVGLVLRVLLHAAERRAEFVSAVTHELRTPLTTLRMYAEMLAEGRVKPERHQRYFDTLRREADRLAQLVDNVLSFSRVEAAAKVNRVEAIELDQLLGKVVDRARERAEKANMQLTVESSGVSRPVRADVAAVEQIVFNLVDNACKYASEASDRRIVVTAAKTQAGGRLVVRDFGPGIDSIGLRRLFRPFQRPQRAETSTKPGVGLGLSLCRKLARSMDGELRLDPLFTPGAGFELLLAAANGAKPAPA